jgi:tetratricopeptide (TPR) repeat protein
MRDFRSSSRRILKCSPVIGRKQAKTDSAIAEWSRAGKAAQAGNAFSEAQESYQQAIALLNLLPESPERDLRELELRRSIVSMLQMTKGWAAPETVDAAERIAALAEKSGNLTHLGNDLGAQGFTALVSGDLSTAGALADQALGLVLREGNPAALASQYLLELMVGYCRGDLAGAEQHFTTGPQVFRRPRLQTNLDRHRRCSLWLREPERLDAGTSRRCPRANGPDDGSRKHAQPS